MVDQGHKGTPQIGDGKYYKRGAPYDGVISSKWSEKKIERFIRAMTHLPYPFATYKGIEIKSISEFKNLSRYLSMHFKVDAIESTTNHFHIMRHYYISHRMLNPYGIIPQISSKILNS